MLACVLALGANACKQKPTPPPPVAVAPVPVANETEDAGAVPSDAIEGDETQTFRLPSGALPMIACDDARRIVKQVASRLPFTRGPTDPKGFEKDLLLWLDPHGYLVDSADSPLPKVIQKHAGALLADLEQRRETCAKSKEIATAFAPFANELLAAYRKGYEASVPVVDLQAAAAKELPDDSKARTRAEELGKVAGGLAKKSPELQAYVDRMQSRMIPVLSEQDWQGVVLASAVRAWVPQVDAHSSWAPLDEESTLYDVDLDDIAKGRIWKRARPSALGAIAEEPTAPILATDVVLAVDDVTTGGLSLEQLDQLAVAPFELKDTATVRVLRGGLIVTLKVKRHTETPSGGPPLPMVERIRHGEGDLAVFRVEDVHDNLGVEMGREIALLKHGERPVHGIVLDLRGNGGGSVDGAIDALSHFIPKAPMCPMHSHDGVAPPDVTSEPPAEESWKGAVLALVDYDTASAAEILAGSLAAYKRGLIVGTPTYGKGCVQEYVDDEPRTGVLRVTSYLYALPDGKPVQRVGLKPDIYYPFMKAAKDLEAKTPHVAPPWSGPDVREKPLVEYPELPKAGGPIGPCRDKALCAAIELLEHRPPRIAKRK
ncbi:MAG: S41 family peptidase [Polyangiaceae bacterium]